MDAQNQPAGLLSKSEIDAMIALPEYLTAPDGRRFEIIAWFPVAEVDRIPTAEIQVIIKSSGRKGGRC